MERFYRKPQKGPPYYNLHCNEKQTFSGFCAHQTACNQGGDTQEYYTKVYITDYKKEKKKGQ